MICLNNVFCERHVSSNIASICSFFTLKLFKKSKLMAATIRRIPSSQQQSPTNKMLHPYSHSHSCSNTESKIWSHKSMFQTIKMQSQFLNSARKPPYASTHEYGQLKQYMFMLHTNEHENVFSPLKDPLHSYWLILCPPPTPKKNSQSLVLTFLHQITFAIIVCMLHSILDYFTILIQSLYGTKLYPNK